jgi:hypothetical protein
MKEQLHFPVQAMGLGHHAEQKILLGGEREFRFHALPDYSKISSRHRCSAVVAAAESKVRRARAVRPCLPMTLPRSSGATANS